MSSPVPHVSVADQRASSSVLDMIGRTPLVRLHRFEREIPAGVELYAKAEWQNPGGSVKDRAAARMLPAQKRLEARDRPVFQAHDRLVGEGEFAALDCPVQVGFELQAVGAYGAEGRAERLDPVFQEKMETLV